VSIVLKSGIINLHEPSGPARHVQRLFYLYLLNNVVNRPDRMLMSNKPHGTGSEYFLISGTTHTGTCQEGLIIFTSNLRQGIGCEIK